MEPLLMTRGRGTGFVLLALAVLLLGWIVSYTSRVPPSFDGAMNLQVAWSLAEGEGYRRTYDDRAPFPQEIQTDAPYVVPAALSYEVFGVGIAQSQLVNQLYLALFALAAAWLLQRRTGWLGAGLGAAFALATPGILRYGMSGYGEIVALAWALLALVAFPWDDTRRTLLRCVLAGACLGLALCTKTVMAICVVAFGGTMAAVALTARAVPLRARLLQVGALGAATLLPYLAFEAWRRASVVAHPAADATDWSARLQMVLSQAGLASGFNDTANASDKLAEHARLLGQFFHLPAFALWIWLAGAFAIAVALVATRRIDVRRHAPLFALLLAAGVYFAWWLLLTPTAKAWHRRILDGALLLNVAWAYLAAYLAMRATGRGPMALRAAAWLPALACVLFGVQFFRADALPILRTTPDTRNLERTVALVKSLPRDAQLFGMGWYSAPTVSLLAERPVLDFNDTVVGTIDPRRPVFFIFDEQALAVHRNDDLTRLYKAQPLLPAGIGYQVYRVDMATFAAMPAPSASAPAQPRVDLLKDPYPYVAGFYGAEGSGTRWMRSEAAVVLKYDGSPALTATVYVLPPPKYMRPDGVTLDLSLDGCRAPAQRVARGGLYPVTFAIPETCRPPVGKDVLVRINVDNVVAASITRDDRSLAISMKDIGFAAATP